MNTDEIINEIILNHITQTFKFQTVENCGEFYAIQITRRNYEAIYIKFTSKATIILSGARKNNVDYCNPNYLEEITAIINEIIQNANRPANRPTDTSTTK